MRLLPGALALAVAAGVVAAVSPAPAGAAFSDALCPEATQYVLAIGTLRAAPPLGTTAGGDPPQAVYDAVHATTSAYDSCAKRLLGNANIEPGVHYAYTRQAQFLVLEARALLALNRPSEAKAVAQNARRLADDVVGWRRSYNQSGSVIASSDKDTRPSAYAASARDIVTAADQLLATLTNVTASSPSPSASAAASPAPAASPHR